MQAFLRRVMRIPPFLVFKWSVYALLAVNIYLFLVHGTLGEALDSLGWVLLLMAFEVETSALDQPYAGRWEKMMVHGLRGTGYLLIAYATWSYFEAGMWLDLANALTWLAVCAMLEYDVYAPGEYGGTEWRVRNILKGVLYALLAGYAIWWGVTAEVLDFYDAALWILCFGAIEMNIVRHEVGEEGATGAAAE